ncbi:hypothetical protein [Pectobacterium phage PcCB7V]|nr:hypothetical protein [Pectobacterium phage PcCB7V]
MYYLCGSRRAGFEKSPFIAAYFSNIFEKRTPYRSQPAINFPRVVTKTILIGTQKVSVSRPVLVNNKDPFCNHE